MTVPDSKLVNALESAGCTVRGASVVCAFHGDTIASGSIYTGSDGRSRYKCHGCDVAGDAADIIARHTGRPLAEVLNEREGGSASMARISPRNGQKNKAQRSFAMVEELAKEIYHQTPEAIYRYANQQGQDILAVLRLSGKQFRQARWTADGWQSGGVAEPFPLYHQLELAGDVSAVVVVTEGEKDADALAILGIMATTAPMGADAVTCSPEKDGKPGKVDWSPLAGRTVVLFGDDDAPGRNHMTRVARCLARLNPPPMISMVRVEDHQGCKDAADLLGKVGEECVRIAIKNAVVMPSQSIAVIDPRRPYVVAQTFALGFEQNGKRLVHHHDRWLSYSGTHYREVGGDELRAIAYRWLNQQRKLDGSLLNVSQTLVNNVLDGLRSAVHEGGDHLPRWTGTDSHPHPSDLISFHNGLLDVKRWRDDPLAELLPHNPAWLSTNVLPFDYMPAATCPHWEAFIDEVSAGDESWIAGMAMMCGYLLTHDTTQQKIFLLQGAPRSGKGTICRVLREMLGHSNVAAPSLSSLCGEFGLWPLVGKSVAVIPDAHSGRGSDATRVLEVLKSISGEDAMDVNRKHHDQQTMRLSVRFLIACNSMLDLPDPSGALAGRLVLFPFSRTFQDKEDHGLEARLLTELPGILRWSLEGLRALRSHGRLIQPKSGEQVRADFARLSSPIRGFIDERMKVDPAGSVLVQDAFNAWRAWCEQEGHQPGASSTFGAKLLSAAPGITKHRPGSRADRQWAYSGISLLRSDETLGQAWTRVTT